MYVLSTSIAIYSHLDLFLETISISVRLKKKPDLNTPVKSYRIPAY